MKKGKIGNIHPLHIVSNLIGLTIFPFIARGILAGQLAKISDKQFAELMEERKKLIPIWMEAMMNPAIYKKNY